jgi:hypothetical protein
MLRVTSILTLGPSGIVFNEPGVTLQFPINAVLVQYGQNAGLVLALFKDVNGVWMKQAGTPWVDSTINSTLVNIMGFSQYAVFLMPVDVPSQTTVLSSSTVPSPAASTTTAGKGLLPETSPGPLLAPAQDANISVKMIAVIAGTVVAGFLIFGGGIMLLLRRRQSYKQKGLFSTDTKPLLAPMSVEVEVKPKEGRSDMQRELKSSVRPTFAEPPTNLLVQSDFIMADGSIPPWDEETSEVQLQIIPPCLCDVTVFLFLFLFLLSNDVIFSLVVFFLHCTEHQCGSGIPFDDRSCASVQDCSSNPTKAWVCCRC